MESTVKSVRLDARTVREIERLAAVAGKTFCAFAGELLAEAAKTRRCPGILFSDGPSGRRARIEGTGLDVWEVVGSYLSVGRDEKRLRKSYSWLTDRQILAALGYYRTYSDEIERLIEANQAEGASFVAEHASYARRSRR